MKKKITVFFLPMFLIFLTGCNSNEVVANYPFLQKKDENITLLFSDDHYLNEEGNYYDALLEVKRKHPEKIRSFNIIHSSDRDLIRYYEVTEFPTLLVIHNELITLRVEGALNKQTILQEIEQELLYK